MDEQKETLVDPFDAEWEIAKMRGRFTDIMNMIEDLKATDRSLSGRISRLKLARIEEEGEEELPEEEREDVRSQVERMSLEERALLMAKLTDRE